MRKITDVQTAELKPCEYSHKSDNAIAALKDSIEKFGIQQPIIIDNDNNIVAGNAVFKAAVECGYTTLPCVRITDLSEQEIRKYRIADNKTGEFAQWNEEKLKKELSYLQQPEELQFCFDENLMKYMNPFADLSPSNGSNKSNSDWSQNNADSQRTEDRFRERLQLEEENSRPKAADYFSYECPCCGKKVTVKI